jgi:hypothetical protein
MPESEEILYASISALLDTAPRPGELEKMVLNFLVLPIPSCDYSLPTYKWESETFRWTQHMNLRNTLECSYQSDLPSFLRSVFLSFINTEHVEEIPWKEGISDEAIELVVMCMRTAKAEKVELDLSLKLDIKSLIHCFKIHRTPL